ncbi:hypothetical protein [Weissella viridescens]|uniref:hypothetical protein n=1 Tax=Weissella viridescens TaxID=1629 RepID=UPI004057A9BB
MNSEEFLYKKLGELDGTLGWDAFSSRSTLEKSKKGNKKLANAAKSIAGGIDESYILGVFDNSIFGDGKAGIAFTGNKIYIHEAFEDDIVIDLEKLSDFDFESKKVMNEKGKESTLHKLKLIEGDSEKIYKTDVVNKGFAQVAQVLDGFKDQVEEVSANSQSFDVEGLDDEALLAYLELFYDYLLDDDVVTSKEMRDLVQLQAKMSISDDLANRFQEYRLGNQNKPTQEELIQNLIDKIPVGSQKTMFELFVTDMLETMSKEERHNIEENSYVVNVAEKLGVDQKVIDYYVRVQDQSERIINERLNDSQVSSIRNELFSIGAAAGASVSTLAATGAYLGAFGSAGLGSLAFLSLSTGGIALAAVGIGAGSIGAYKGMKYLVSGKDKEKYTLRDELLNGNIDRLNKAQQYLLMDINYFTDTMNDLLGNHSSLVDQNKQLMEVVNRLKVFMTAGKEIRDQTRIYAQQTMMSQLPSEIDVATITDLTKDHVNSEEILSDILKFYKDGGLRNDLTERDLQFLEARLKQINYPIGDDDTAEKKSKTQLLGSFRKNGSD